MGRALSSERVYLSLLGRSAWALLNTYFTPTNSPFCIVSDTR